MELIHSENKADSLVEYRKTFADKQCEGYRFDFKSGIKNNGVRCLCYCRQMHSVLVSHIQNSRVHIIDLLTGQIRWFDHHSSTVRKILVNDRRKEIVTASWDGSICITDFNSLNLRLRLTEKSMGRSPHVELAAGQDLVYSYSYDSDKDPELTSNVIRIWSLADGSLKQRIRLRGEHIGMHRSGSCLAEGNSLFAVSNSGYFHILDNLSGALEEEYCCSNDELHALCSVPKHNIVLFGGTSGNIYQYKKSSGRILKFSCHNSNIMHIEISGNNSERMISIGSEGSIKIWKFPRLKLISATNVYQNYLWTLSLINNLILTSGDEGDIWIYDISDPGKPVLKGRMVVFDQSYAFLQNDSKSFYSSDLGNMQVIKRDDNSMETSRFAEYLLSSMNSPGIFHDLFNNKTADPFSKQDSHKPMLQIPGYFE